MAHHLYPINLQHYRVTTPPFIQVRQRSSSYICGFWIRGELIYIGSGLISTLRGAVSVLEITHTKITISKESWDETTYTGSAA